MTALTIPPRVAVAVVLPRAVRITATARLRAVRAHHGDPYADARGLVCLPRRDQLSRLSDSPTAVRTRELTVSRMLDTPCSRGSTDRGGRDPLLPSTIVPRTAHPRLDATAIVPGSPPRSVGSGRPRVIAREERAKTRC